jgi:hypothetical protein
MLSGLKDFISKATDALQAAEDPKAEQTRAGLRRQSDGEGERETAQDEGEGTHRPAAVGCPWSGPSGSNPGRCVGARRPLERLLDRSQGRPAVTYDQLLDG